MWYFYAAMISLIVCLAFFTLVYAILDRIGHRGIPRFPPSNIITDNVIDDNIYFDNVLADTPDGLEVLRDKQRERVYPHPDKAPGGAAIPQLRGTQDESVARGQRRGHSLLTREP